MRKCLVWLIALILLCVSAYAEDLQPAPKGWVFLGYVFGGITYAVPDDYESWELGDEEKAAGIVALGGNADCTIQLRGIKPDVITYEDFVTLITQESSAQVSTRKVGEVEAVFYRNTEPSEGSELYGIALTGLDDLLYKISIFTGENGAFGEDAKVWKIAETLASTVQQRDFSEWGLESTPEP